MTNHAFAASQTDAQPTKSVYCFSVHAAAEPDVMPRVLELFAKRNLVPASWHSTVADGNRGFEELQIDIQVQQLEATVGGHVARCLCPVVHVNTLLTSEKGYSNSALSA